MLRTLLKMRFASLFSSMFAGKNKRRSVPLIVLFSVLFLWAIAAFFVFFLGGLLAIGLPLFERSAEHVYFGVGLLAALVLMLASSVVYTKNQLYVAGDNELLLAMPIPPRLILASRLILLLALNYLLEAVVALPMLLVWLLVGSVTVGGLLSLLLILLLLPAAALALTSLLAWLLARIAARIRKKSLASLLFSLLFLGVYFAFVFGLEGMLESLSTDITPLCRFVDAVPPLAALGRAAAGSPLDLVPVSLILILFTLAVFAWLSRTYLRTVLENRGAKRIAYRERKTAARSPLLALTGRELRHLASSSGYMMNVGLGLIFALAVPLFLLIEGSLVGKLAALGDPVGDLLTPIALTVTNVTLSMAYFSAVTVSLEGPSLWIVRSSPVPTRTVLASKVLYHLVLTVPTVTVTGILYAVLLRAGILEALMLILASYAFALFSALFGLAMNLLFPKLEWKNELVPVKQGASVLLAMLGCPLAGSVFGGIAVVFSLLLPTAVALLLSTLIMLAASLGLAAFVFKGGVRMFESL